MATKKQTTKASAPSKPDSTQPVESPPEADPQVAARMGVETAQGFRGTEVDSTPNENYTVAGVTSGKPTPETEREAGTRTPVHALEDGKIVER